LLVATDHYQSLPVGDQLVELGATLRPEGSVSHGKDLIDEEHIHVDVDRHREREAHEHPGGLVFDLLVDERLDLAESDDLVVTLFDLMTLHTQDRRVEKHVLTTGELGMEPRADLDQPRHAAT